MKLSHITVSLKDKILLLTLTLDQDRWKGRSGSSSRPPSAAAFGPQAK